MSARSYFPSKSAQTSSTLARVQILLASTPRLQENENKKIQRDANVALNASSQGKHFHFASQYVCAQRCTFSTSTWRPKLQPLSAIFKNKAPPSRSTGSGDFDKSLPINWTLGVPVKGGSAASWASTPSPHKFSTLCKNHSLQHAGLL